MNTLHESEFLQRELDFKNVMKHLQRLNDLPMGDILAGQKHYKNISVLKVGTEIHLIFFHQVYHELQSRIDLNDPLNLIAPYTQIMMLGLLWNANPSNIHIIGLGGGRVPFVLHHYFPEIKIEITEIDPDVIDIATKYFGFMVDPNVKIVLADGRKYLQNRNSLPKYDIIMVDAFNGVGFGAQSLATKEFWTICKNQLQPNGLVISNILQGDALILSKIHTISSCFQTSYICQNNGAVVIFAHDGDRIDTKDLISKAEIFEKKHLFPFPFLSNATSLHYLNKITDPVLIENKKIQILTDSFPHESLPIDKLILSQINRNDLCPCGSGVKFKKCHGFSADKINPRSNNNGLL